MDGNEEKEYAVIVQPQKTEVSLSERRHEERQELKDKIKTKILGWLRRPGKEYLGESAGYPVYRVPGMFDPEWSRRPEHEFTETELQIMTMAQMGIYDRPFIRQEDCPYIALSHTLEIPRAQGTVATGRRRFILFGSRKKEIMELGRFPERIIMSIHYPKDVREDGERVLSLIFFDGEVHIEREYSRYLLPKGIGLSRVPLKFLNFFDGILESPGIVR